jgi:hypothetical protein
MSTGADHYQMGQLQQNQVSIQVEADQNRVGQAQNRVHNPAQAVQPQPQSGNAADASAEKIRELELRLQIKEESERVRREAAEREKVAILLEKQKWEEEKIHESREIKRTKLQLAQQQEVLVKSKEELERMRVQVEDERKISAKESDQLRQMLRVQQSAQKDQRAFTVNQGLPAGWEKLLDRTTGRFYYVDHKSKTTHWNPPANWLDYQAHLQRRMSEGERGSGGQISGPAPQIAGPPGQIQRPLAPQQQQVNAGGRVARHDNAHPAQVSNQSPQQQPIRNPVTPTPVDSAHPRQLPHPQTGHPIREQAVPSVDRSSKPITPATPSVDRSTKPTISPEAHKRKVNALQPMFGSSQGYGLTGLRNLGNTCFMNKLWCNIEIVLSSFSGRFIYWGILFRGRC